MASSAPRLSDQIGQRIERATRDMTPALRAVGEAWAQATQAEAPLVTGALSASVHYEPTGPQSGALILRGYGDIVGEGVPGEAVETAARRVVRMPPLSQSKRATAARARYQKRVGRAVAHPNPFYLRAWQAPAVRDAVRQFPRLVFNQGK